MSQTLMPFTRMVTNAMAFRTVDLYHQLHSVLAIFRGECKNEPVTDMWRGHIGYFLLYSRALDLIYARQVPFVDSVNFTKQLQPFHDAFNAGPYKKPPWIGDPWVHRSHRSRLLSYDYTYYEHKFPGNPLKMPMVWPRIDDSDSRGYRLFIEPISKIVLDKGMMKLPAELRIGDNLEVLEV